MSKGSAPAAPDPYTTAQAQYQEATQAGDYQTALNDVNTVGPTGSTSYAVTGTDPTTGAPIRTETTTLSPAEQSLLTGQQNTQLGQLGLTSGLLDQASSAISSGSPQINPVQYSVPNQSAQTSINTSNVPGIQSVQGLNGLEQQSQSQALAGEQAAIQPALQAQYEQLDASLRNSGNGPGTPAYQTAMSQFMANEGNEETQAAGAAITAGTGLENTVYGEEANTNQQLFGQQQAQEQAYNSGVAQNFSQGLQEAGLNNSAGTTALQDYATQLGIPLNELSSILSGTQVATPSANQAGTASIQAPNIEDAFNTQYQGALAGYNADVSTGNAELGDATSLGSLGVLGYLASTGVITL